MSTVTSSRAARISVAAATCLGFAAPVVLAPAPADAHTHRRLTASLVTANWSCMEDIFCAVEGKVRVFNRRAPGTGAIVICVGVDVHTADHRSLSIEPPLPDGQAVIRLRPGQSGVTTYRTVFNEDNGVADHVTVTHVHKHVVHGFSGEQC